ncbi:MAG TPA: Fic family protein [Patescibacteria group bacterium]|nr:Fic family protein [Patescibacteria group bacterium]
MLRLDYHLSPTLQHNLQNIEAVRVKILTTALSPKHELRFKWETKLLKIYSSLCLSGSDISKKQIIGILSSGEKKKANREESEIIRYRNCLDHIRNDWMASGKNIGTNDVKNLYDVALVPVGSFNPSLFNTKEKDLKKILDYVQSSKENPIIQAGIVQIQIHTLQPFKEGNGIVSRLLTDLILYKNGYDVRELIAPEIEMYNRQKSHDIAIDLCIKEDSMSKWLDYFVYITLLQLKNVATDITESKFLTDSKNSNFNLNSRQKKILLFLEAPNSKLANKDVQKMFSVSQITASRDLSHLAGLGLLIGYGKARSKVYMKS